MAEEEKTIDGTKDFLNKLSEKNLPDDKVDEIVAKAKAAGLSAAEILRVHVAAEHKKGNKVFEPMYQAQEPTPEFLNSKAEEVAKKSADLNDKKGNQFNPDTDIDQYGRIRNRNFGKENNLQETDVKSDVEKSGIKPMPFKKGPELDL